MWGKNEAGASQHVTAAERPGSGKPANKHLISEDAISLQKIIGQGEFGVVQQAIWANDDGERVSAPNYC